MNIQTVRDHLVNVINDKQEFLDQLESSGKEGYTIIRHMVELNINELKSILADVNQCLVEQSWRDNPDRSGGQFTQEEIDNHDKWI